ncbi:type II toxin-antitoxin system Phd/YefM family antitoxin [Candidatus Poriferisodalis sp.]|uniref:type II toxin-antitoxin system Phd/YefM family antitoxin n=1 Tax=Candidatus Poriferisodalis sp. TaxID=3101277 RepID=UPI003B51E945
MTLGGAGERTIPAGEFKNRCLALMDEVNETGIEIVITKRGRAVSRLVPASRSVPQMWGRYKEHIGALDDLVAPAVPAGDWEVVSDPDRVLDPDRTSQQ